MRGQRELSQVYDRLLNEEYVYWYPRLDIKRMPLYDLLVLAHEIDYKWSQLEKTRPNQNQPLLDMLNKIYDKYSKVMTKATQDFIDLHVNPLFAELKRFGREDGGDNKEGYYLLDLYDCMHVYFDDQYFMNTLNWLDDQNIKIDWNKSGVVYKDGKKLTNAGAKKIMYSPEFQKVYNEDQKAYEEYATTPEVVSAYKALEMLKSNPQTIPDIMRVITLTLNTAHHQGYIISDYVHDGNGIDEGQLDMLSNLSTRMWDKENNQEFGI